MEQIIGNEKILSEITGQEEFNSKEMYALFETNFTRIVQQNNDIKPACVLYTLYYLHMQYKKQSASHDAGLEQAGFRIIEKITSEAETVDWELLELIEKNYALYKKLDEPGLITESGKAVYLPAKKENGAVDKNTIHAGNIAGLKDALKNEGEALKLF